MGAVRRGAAALGPTRAEQITMWEAWWQANRAAVPQTGPLTWVLTLDGPRLAGSHLPAPDVPAPGARHDQHTAPVSGPVDRMPLAKGEGS